MQESYNLEALNEFYCQGCNYRRCRQMKNKPSKHKNLDSTNQMVILWNLHRLWFFLFFKNLERGHEAPRFGYRTFFLQGLCWHGFEMFDRTRQFLEKVSWVGFWEYSIEVRYFALCLPKSRKIAYPKEVWDKSIQNPCAAPVLQVQFLGLWKRGN